MIDTIIPAALEKWVSLISIHHVKDILSTLYLLDQNFLFWSSSTRTVHRHSPPRVNLRRAV